MKKFTIGIYAPSSPAHIWFKEKYEHGKKRLLKLGFEIIEGELIKKNIYEGYRTSNGQERAKELMALVENPNIDIIIPVIGGYNSGSLLPYLDFKKIEKSKKIFCGYSDITALHLGILSKTNLPTIYGVAIVPTFGEYCNPLSYSEEDFIKCLTKENYELIPPEYWSNHFLDAFTEAWKSKREYKQNDGWKKLNDGEVIGEVLAFNINTLVSLLGSEYIPDLTDKILILEEMDATIGIEERSFNSLKLAKIFDKISGLIFSKPEKYDNKNSGISYEELIAEIVGERNYPIIYNFDCGHTLPSLAIPQRSIISLKAKEKVEVRILENSIVKLLS